MTVAAPFKPLKPGATVAKWLNKVSRYFKRCHLYYGHGTDNAWDEAVYLLFTQLGIALDADSKVLSLEVDEAKASKLAALVTKRALEREPVAYLNHMAHYAGLDFYVNNKVLIPRSPMAELIMNRFSPWVENESSIKNVLDLGTGSGCLAILAALALPKVKVDASDISPEALKVCEINIERFKLKARVKPVLSNLFEALTGRTYDVIIANPPYVGDKEMKHLPQEYYAEPSLALHDAGSGADLAIKILQQAAKFLTTRGVLFLEVGNSLPLVLKRFYKTPFTLIEFNNGDSEVVMLKREQLINFCT